MGFGGGGSDPQSQSAPTYPNKVLTGSGQLSEQPVYTCMTERASDCAQCQRPGTQPFPEAAMQVTARSQVDKGHSYSPARCSAGDLSCPPVPPTSSRSRSLPFPDPSSACTAGSPHSSPSTQPPSGPAAHSYSPTSRPPQPSGPTHTPQPRPWLIALPTFPPSTSMVWAI